MSVSAAEVAALVGGTLEGEAARRVEGVAGLEAATAAHLAFYGNAKYKQRYLATQAGVVLVDGKAPSHVSATLIRVSQPTLAYAQAATAFFVSRAPRATGVQAGALVDPTADVAATAFVAAGASVGPKARIGERAHLSAGARVGAGASVGEDTIMHSNAVVADGCLVGARCVLHACSVVGADGFGFVFDAAKPGHVKIPQLGIARLQDDVELGACSCVDRATTGETVVGYGTKIDNLVQVAHNCVIGPHSILCAQVGLSGTSTLGSGVVLAGQVGVAGHLRIGDLARVGAQSGVMNDIDDNATVLGSPAIDHRQALRAYAAHGRLPQVLKSLAELEKRLQALENKS